MNEKGFRVEIPVRIRRGRRAQRAMAAEDAPQHQEPPPRIALLLALAHKWETMIRRGEIRDYTQIARPTGLTRGRIAQICGLVLLAPDLQEAILAPHCNTLPTHTLRQIAGRTNWGEQRSKWQPRVEAAAP